MNTYPIETDDAVYVGADRVLWKVLEVADGHAHLSKYNAFERLDWRGVDVGKLTRAGNL